MRLRLLFSFVTFSFASLYSTADTQTLKSGYDSPLDGQVNAVAINGNNLYVGGTFTKVGYSCGTGVLLDTSNASPVRSFPKLDPMGGAVMACIADGNGGWYVGGQFKHINGVARSYLAHVLSDNSIDSWDPEPNAWVATLSLTGNTLYAGGVFSSVGGQARGMAAAFDVTTGALTPWNPNADGEVTAIQQVGSVVYLGGLFYDLDDTLRFLMGSVDDVHGYVTSYFPLNGGPYGSSYISQFIYDGTYLYACGSFNQINSVTRYGILRMLADGSVDSWNPGVSGDFVDAMVLSGNYLYVAGQFTSIGGQSVTNMAKIDVTTGAATTWAPNPNNQVRSLAMIGEKIFAAGFFTSIGGKSISYVASVDTSTGSARSWDPKLADYAYTLATNGTSLFVGGRFETVGSTTRNCIAEISLSTGLVTSWNPNLGGGVSAIAVAGDKVIVGGGFNSIGGNYTGSYIAAFDTGTGAQILSPQWKATTGAIVNALKIVGDRLYVGGNFTTFDLNTRYYVAAVSKYDGSLLTWNANLNNGGVYAITSLGSVVYIGGFFTQTGTTSRNNAAAFDTTTDTVTSWDPSPDNAPYTMCATGSDVYVGGQIFNFGAQSVKSIAAVNASTGALDGSFNANFSLAYPVRASAVSDTQLIIGGDFTSVQSKPRQALAFLSSSSGAVSSFNAYIDTNNGAGSVYALAVGNKTLLAGGYFISALYMPQNNLLIFEDSTLSGSDIPLAVNMTSCRAVTGPGSVTLLWQTRSEINNAGFRVLREGPGETEYEVISSYTSNPSLKAQGNSSSGRDYQYVDNHVQASGAYKYKVQSTAIDGTVKDESALTVTVDLPKSFALYQNYPNPFNPTTVISYQLPVASRVTLIVYDVIGREVKTLVNGRQDAGTYRVNFDGSKLPSGVYFYRISAGDFSSVKRTILLK